MQLKELQTSWLRFSLLEQYRPVVAALLLILAGSSTGSGQTCAPQSSLPAKSKRQADPLYAPESTLPRKDTAPLGDSDPDFNSVTVRHPISAPRLNPYSVIINLPLLVRAAGIIFSGQVISVSRSNRSGPDRLDKINVTFEVENALRDARPRQRLTIHEWVGLWSSKPHYRKGQHLLLFLYPPSRIGFTSPVADPMGRFTIDSSGAILFNEQQIEAFRADPVLGGKSSVRYAVFARAIRLASGEE